MSATLQASAVVSAVDETPVEAHLRRVLDTQPVPLSRVNVDGIFLAVNDAALSILGAERLEQVLDTSLLDMVAPASRESCRVFLSRVVAGDRGSTEVEFTGLGGLAHTLQLHATTHPVSPDGMSSVLVTLRDITEYRRLEHAVVEAAAHEEQRAAAHAAEVARLSTQIAESHANAERKHHDAVERHAALQTQARAEVQAAQQQLETTIADHLSRLTEVEGALRTAEARERKTAEEHEADRGALRLALQQAQDDHVRQVDELRKTVVTLETTLAAVTTREHDLAAAHSRKEAEWRRSLDDAIATHESNTSELRAAIVSLEQSLAEAQARPGDAARTAALEQQLADLERKHHDAVECHTALQTQARAEVQAAQQQLETTIADHLSRLTEVEGALRTAEARERKTAEEHEADRSALRLALQQAQGDHARQVEELRKTVATLETTLAAATTREHDLAAAHSRKEAEWRRSLDDAIATHESNTSELRAAIVSLEQSLAEAQAREQQVGELRAAIAGLETSVSALTQELENAVANRDAVLNEHKEALHKLDAALAANDEEKRLLGAERERARAEWEREHQQARAQWDREHQQLQSKWAAERAEALATWDAERDVLTKHRAELTARIASVETERDELHSDLVMVRHERLAWSARLDHAERLARAGRLSLSFADDIGTALELVAAYGRLLMGDAGQGPHRDSLDQMLAAATTAQALVRQLRRGARTLDVDPLAISPVIHGLERTLAGLLSPDITLRILPGPEGARVGLTSQQVEQVALTLAANRRAAMVKGGQVTIELAEVDIDESCARERMASPGPYVLLAVHAAGPDVEHGIAPRLFGNTADEDTWQTAGPGMSGLFAMVNEWGGCLWASQEGADALAFEIYLPRVMAGRDASTAGAQQ